MIGSVRPHRHLSSSPRCLALAAGLWLLVLAAPLAAQTLQVRLQRIISGRTQSDSTCAVFVMDLADGMMLAQHDGDRAVIPASNQKLITTAAALEILGPDYVFQTKLLRDGQDLIVAGSGDPAFGDGQLLGSLEPAMTVEDLLDRWVGVVRQRRIRQVDRIVVDDRVFDRQFVHPNWPVDQLNRWYCAQVAGINFNNNCLDIFTAPTSPGQAPSVRTMPLDPPVQFNIVARTDPNIRTDAPWFTREDGTNRITVHGRVKLRRTAPAFVTIHDPPQFFGELLANRLGKAGINVSTVTVAADEDDFRQAELIAVVRTPLAVVLQRCNQDSQNLFAEALIKRIGRSVTGEPGSWKNGSAVLRRHLAKVLGPDASRLVIDDGSGMSRENRLTPRLLTRVLQHMYDSEKLWPTFRDSLALGGTNGTLERRFNGGKIVGRVRAKSGYLKHVISLSGYVEHDHRAVAFAVILNDYKDPVHTGKALIDKIVREIDAHLAKTAPAIP